MVAERADQPHRLLERVFDLEAQAVETNDLDGRQGSVGAHQEAGASGGMDHGHEAHEPAGRAPQQVADLILDDHPALAVDGAVGLLETLGVFQQGAEPDLAAIDPGPASLARAALLMGGVGDGVGLHPGDQVVVADKVLSRPARGCSAEPRARGVRRAGSGGTARSADGACHDGSPAGPTEQLVWTERSADRGEPADNAGIPCAGTSPRHAVLLHPAARSRLIHFRALIRHRPDGEYLLVAQDMTGIRAFRALLLQSCLWGGLATVLVGFIGAAMAGADAVRRIDGVTRAMQRIIRGDLSGRLPTRGDTGDLDRLALQVNFMLGEIERLMSEVKGVCDNVAHDLRTPLTRLLGGLERVHRRPGSAEQYAAAIDEAIQDVRGVLKTFAAMLRIAEVESGARRAGFTSVDLSQITADVVEFYELRIGGSEGDHAVVGMRCGGGDARRSQPVVRGRRQPGGQWVEIYPARRPGECAQLRRRR